MLVVGSKNSADSTDSWQKRQSEKIIKQKDKNDAIASARKTQVGSGDRSEKIRTYNYPQSRITDHRISLTLHSLESFLNGNIDDMIDALITADTAEKLKENSF